LWVQKSKWLFLGREDSERWRSIIARLEGWKAPMVPFEREGYLVIKVDAVREFLRFSASDLIHDAVLSDKKLVGLEELGWREEVLKPTPELLALWAVGLEFKVESKFPEVRRRYYSLLEELRRGKNASK
jgi:hypothetical protein